MAIEKVITPGEGMPVVKIDEEEDIVVDEDGNAEITIQDQQILDEADAMGLLDEEAFTQDDENFNSNLVEFILLSFVRYRCQNVSRC